MADTADETPPAAEAPEAAAPADGAGEAGEAEPEVPRAKPPADGGQYCIRVLPFVMASQLQHGLRHNDFQRYRQYCSRRLRRIRKSLHFLNGRKHFNKKKLTVDKITEERYFHIPLVQAERAWSFAMQLKQFVQSEPRNKFTLVNRLRKAAQHAQQLKDLVDKSLCCDELTQLEAQAYCAWMTASAKFELQDWPTAKSLYGEAKMIYTKLMEVCQVDEKHFYETRLEEIDANLRYCAYNCDDGGDINDLVQIRNQLAKSGQLDLLSSKIDAVLSQKRTTGAETLSEISWLSHQVPIRGERIRSAVIECRSKEAQLDTCEPGSELGLYDALFLAYSDAISAIRSDRAVEEGSQSQKAAINLQNLQLLEEYFTNNTITRTMSRNRLMLQKELDAFEESPNPAKAMAIVRWYDVLLRNLSEMGELHALQDHEPFVNLSAAKQLHFKAFRCFYLAESFRLADKSREALALYERTEDYVADARTHFGVCEGDQAALVEAGSALGEQVRGKKYAVQATCFMLAQGPDAAQQNDLSKEAVSEHLNEYVAVDLANPNLVKLPPDFEPAHCKPLFFDLADQTNDWAPDLSHRLQSGGAVGAVTGMLKGLTSFWG